MSVRVYIHRHTWTANLSHVTIFPFGLPLHWSKVEDVLRLTRTCHAAPMPCRVNSHMSCCTLAILRRAVFFVKIRVVAGRSRTRAGRPHAVSGRPMLIQKCHAHAALWRDLEKSRSERNGHGIAQARHGTVNQTRPHCVNQMGKTQSEPLAARHGRGKAWARYGNGMVCVN
jgi:hypothetical protein